MKSGRPSTRPSAAAGELWYLAVAPSPARESNPFVDEHQTHSNCVSASAAAAAAAAAALDAGRAAAEAHVSTPSPARAGYDQKEVADGRQTCAERRQSLTVPVQRVHSHEQVEEVGCAPEPRCHVEPKPPCQFLACQTACTAMHGGLGAEALFGIRCLSDSPGFAQEDCMTHQHMLALRCAPGALSSRLKRRSFTASWRARACSRNYDERNHLQPCSTDDWTMLDVRMYNAAVDQHIVQIQHDTCLLV